MYLVGHTVDGRNLSLVVYPILYFTGFFYIPSGCLGFQPWTVSRDQQIHSILPGPSYPERFPRKFHRESACCTSCMSRFRSPTALEEYLKSEAKTTHTRVGWYGIGYLKHLWGEVDSIKHLRPNGGKESHIPSRRRNVIRWSYAVLDNRLMEWSWALQNFPLISTSISTNKNVSRWGRS